MKPSNSPASIARRAGRPCSVCSEEHVKPNGKPSCDGHTSAGRACGNHPIPGGFVCRQRHGGAAPQVRAAAAKRLSLTETENEVGRLLREATIPDLHPLDGLLDVVRQTGGMVTLLRQLTGQLVTDPGEIWTTVTLGKDSHREIRVAENAALTGYDDRGNEVPAVRLELYAKWLRLYLDSCKTALAADVEERLVRSATATSEAFFNALNVAMTAAQLTPEQHEDFRAAIAAELRKLNTGLLV